MAQTGKEWLGLSVAWRLVASSVQDWQPLPVLWTGKVARRGRRRSGRFWGGRSAHGRNQVGRVAPSESRGLIAQQRVAAGNRPAVASLRRLLCTTAERERSANEQSMNEDTSVPPDSRSRFDWHPEALRAPGRKSEDTMAWHGEPPCLFKAAEGRRLQRETHDRERNGNLGESDCGGGCS